MPKTSLAILNGEILTQNPAMPRAEAIAIAGDRIVQLGSTQEIKQLCGPHTKIIDAGGATILPGFIDSHFHLVTAALRFAELNLRNLTSFADLAAAIASGPRTGNWIVGRYLPYALGPKGSNPTRQDLDQICPHSPALIYSTDGHTAWANTKALAIAGILDSPPSVPSGEVGRAADGTASGELREFGAFSLVNRHIPTLGLSQQRELVKQALGMIAKAGITSVHNMDGDAEQFELLRTMDTIEELSLRVLLPLRVRPHTPLQEFEQVQDWSRLYKGRHLRTGLIKFLLDGVVESRTAFLSAPYADGAGACGAPLYEPADYLRRIEYADKLGSQIAVHAIGDAAVKLALDAFERLPGVNGTRERRHRIEHIEICAPSDIGRFSATRVIASMQPLHCPTDMPAEGDAWLSGLGPQRLKHCYQWRAFLKAGVPLAFGSDWPVVSFNPLLGIKSALNRSEWSNPDEPSRLTLDECLLAYTRAGAYTEFQEREKGTLAPGMLADVVVLNRNLSSAPAEQINTVQVACTIVGGKTVYSS